MAVAILKIANIPFNNLARLKMYQIKPIELKVANEFITRYHRHNKKVAGHKFSIGLWDNGELVGVGVAGRPVARLLDNGRTLEVIRVCVKENNHNGCSKIYGRIKQIGQLMGYEKIITYTLKKESQSSLKAINAVVETEVKAQKWDRPSRKRIEQQVYKEDKIRWNLTPSQITSPSATSHDGMELSLTGSPDGSPKLPSATSVN